MREQVPVAENARVELDSHGSLHEVAPDLAYQRLAIVNVAFIGVAGAGSGEWVLIDAGIPGSGAALLGAVARRFGEHSRPAAIVLTHGHFDHVGSLEQLARQWDVSVYAPPAEMPYLDLSQSYPPPDPTVGGGLMSSLASFYPRGPVDVRPYLKPLPADGTIPVLPGWQWIPTPGHTDGHVSFWRAADRTLLAGDAFITTNQESAYAVALQRLELHGPPMYYTTDWTAARHSVETLAALEPELVVTGHGRALGGAEMRKSLHELARNFDQVARPEHGKYVGRS